MGDRRNHKIHPQDKDSLVPEVIEPPSSLQESSTPRTNSPTAIFGVPLTAASWADITPRPIQSNENTMLDEENAKVSNSEEIRESNVDNKSVAGEANRQNFDKKDASDANDTNADDANGSKTDLVNKLNTDEANGVNFLKNSSSNVDEANQSETEQVNRSNGD